MTAQLSLTESATIPQLSPMQRNIYAVLRDYRPHSALEFKKGVHGFYCDAVSQRIGDLKRKGYNIESTGKGGVASYRLVRAW